MSPAVDGVRDLFARVEYTGEAVAALLGPVAAGALGRDEIAPALRVTRGGSPLEALIRLFRLRARIPESALPTADLLALGLVERDGGEVRALVEVEPLETGGYAVSDFPVRQGEGTPRTDHVIHAGRASASLSRIVVRQPVGSALDLGTGSGVQTLRLAGRARDLVATDVNPRALHMARLGFALSGLERVETLEGSLFEPVAGRTFDLIVSNPPCIVSPDRRYTYRESDLPGDDFCRRLVRRAPHHLNPGGWCQLLANWLHIGGVPWEERPASWVEGSDAWVVQRDVVDPAEYAELALRDSREVGLPEYERRYDDWLEAFTAAGVIGVGFGWITLRKTETGGGTVRVEDLRQTIEQPVGGYIDTVFAGFGARVSSGIRLRTTAGVVQEQVGPPGGADPERIVLRQTSGLRRAAAVGTVEAALAGACDGDLPLGPLLEAIAELMHADPAEVRSRAFDVLPDLIADGFFEVLAE